MPRLGTRKLYHILQKEMKELGVGRDKLFTILKSNQMSINSLKSYRITTHSHHRFHKHKDLISGIIPSRPEQVWVSDITYIGNRGDHSYLSLITDAYSKKIVGYNLSDSLRVEGSLKALEMATNNRKYKNEPLIHHSDRGIQYCCDLYQELLKKNNLKVSMTESYDPYANAVAERVNGILKSEFLLEKYHVDRHTRKQLVKNSIEIYNTKRPHYSCYMLTPEEMHQQRKVKIKTYKKDRELQA
jgi:transposase InsO family protein